MMFTGLFGGVTNLQNTDNANEMEVDRFTSCGKICQNGHCTGIWKEDEEEGSRKLPGVHFVKELADV